MTVRSDRVAGPVAIAAAWTAIYVVPAGHTVRINAVWITNTHPTDPALCSVSLAANVSGILLRTNVLPQSTALFNGVLVAEEGETIWARKETTGSMVVSLHGSKLVGVP